MCGQFHGLDERGKQKEMKEWAAGFYKSIAWQQCRKAYLKSQRGLCERCLAKGIISPAQIVHHKIYITPSNINDPSITLDWKNLECVCRSCHSLIHEGRTDKRYKVDDFGRVECM